MKGLYCSLTVLLGNICLFAQTFGSDEQTTSSTRTSVPDKYVALAVLVLFAAGVFIVVERFRRQRGRKLRQYPKPEDIEHIRRRLNDVA